MMELFNYGFMYNPVLGGKLTLNSAVSYPSSTYELEIHILSGDPLTSQYPVAKLPISTTDAVLYKTSTGTLSFDSSNWTIANTAEKKPVRMAFQYTAANVGTEMRALIDEADGAGVKDLGTQTSNSNNSFLYFGTFSTDAKISRIILRDGPGGAILHDFDAGKVPNSAQTGFVQRDDPDALAGSADIMYDVVGGRTATPDNAGSGAFQVFGSVELVNGQADNIPLVAGDTLTFTATRFDPENITITQDAKTLPLLNIQYDVNTGAGSADVPAVGNVPGFPHTEKTATLNFITSAETQTRTVTVGLPAHLTTITLTGIQDTGVNSLFSGWADPPTTGDEVPHDPTFYTMNFDSSYDIVTSDPNFSTTGYFIDSAGMESYVVNTDGATDPSVTPVTFSGTVPNRTTTVGNSFTHNTSSYFSGTETPFTYSVNGTVPGGLTFDTNTGSFSGTPTTAETQTLSVTATDTAANTATSNSFTITVNAAAGSPPVVTNDTPDQTVTVGDPVTVTATITGADSISWGSDAAGTFGDPNVEDTTYTPNAAGTHTLTVTGTNADGSNSDVAVITAQAAVITPTASITSQGLTAQEGNSAQLTATAQDAVSYLWTASDPSVSFSDDTALQPTVTGNTAGTYTLTLTATSSTGHTAQDTATLTVTAAPVSSTLTVTLTNMSGGSYLTTVYAIASQTVLYHGLKTWSGGSAVFTLDGVEAGTACEVWVRSTSTDGRGIQEGVTV